MTDVSRETLLRCPKCGATDFTSWESTSIGYHGYRFRPPLEGETEIQLDDDGVYDSTSGDGEGFEDDLVCLGCSTHLSSRNLIDEGVEPDRDWTGPAPTEEPEPTVDLAFPIEVLRAAALVLVIDQEGQPILRTDKDHLQVATMFETLARAARARLRAVKATAGLARRNAATMKDVGPTEKHSIGELAGKVHKATPTPAGQHCAVCGQRIKTVPGGQGKTFIHTDSGAVAAPNPPTQKETP